MAGGEGAGKDGEGAWLGLVNVWQELYKKSQVKLLAI